MDGAHGCGKFVVAYVVFMWSSLLAGSIGEALNVIALGERRLPQGAMLLVLGFPTGVWAVRRFWRSPVSDVIGALALALVIVWAVSLGTGAILLAIVRALGFPFGGVAVLVMSGAAGVGVAGWWFYRFMVRRRTRTQLVAPLAPHEPWMEA